MPFRLGERRAKVQFVTFARMPYLIWLACMRTSTVSQTRYIQEAVCEKLARDLGMSHAELLAELPPTRTMSAYLPDDPPGDPAHHYPVHIRRDGGTFRIGPSGAHEHIKGE